MKGERLGQQVGAAATAVRLSEEQRQQIAAALNIDVKFVPEELAVLGVHREAGRHTGVPVDRAGQFAPALVVM